jgi:hypothetical protein
MDCHSDDEGLSSVNSLFSAQRSLYFERTTRPILPTSTCMIDDTLSRSTGPQFDS